MKKQFTIFLILIFILGLVPINFSEAITQNQIDAEVQIVCTDGSGNWLSGSGTIIDPKGIILTNRHVIEGAYMNTCFIGFIESINKEPNFGTEENPNLAEVKYYTTSNDMDAAILYLDNPTNKIYPYVNIWNSNSNNLQLGEKLEIIGFPGVGGSTITYTSGDFSGYGGASDGTQNYLKTTAWIGHGNSGGAAYKTAESFIGIPTMSITKNGDTMNYLLSVSSIKNWLYSLLGNQYESQIIEDEPIIQNTNINLQDDITPPHQDKFFIGFYALDNNGKEIYYGNRYDDNISAIYEFSRIRFSWSENCVSNSEYCINDDDGLVREYYYYFGNNLNANPKIDGKHILSKNLIKPNSELARVELPEIFEAVKGEKNYFILQAVDDSGNISNPLISFEYTYEPDKFKDIKDAAINDYSDSLIGKLIYPRPDEIPAVNNNPNVQDSAWIDYTVKDIYTNQKTLYLYPNYDYKIDGLTYYISYGGQYVFNDTRDGWSTDNRFIKINDINKNKEINIYVKPFKNSLNKFTSKYLILRIHYDATLTEKIVPVKKSMDHLGELKFQKIDSNLINKLKGQILLQVEQNGEAYYIYPGDSKKYYLGRPSDAFQVMRKLGLGATHDFITSHTIYPDNVLGKILLDVEQNGEAYYIYPKDKKAYYLGRPADAFKIMRELGLGITNSDLNKIPEGSL